MIKFRYSALAQPIKTGGKSGIIQSWPHLNYQAKNR